MLLRSLYLQHFRNYEETHVEFSQRLNLICGPNAQGKTNILEAIHCLMLGRSFRSSQNIELIGHGLTSFYLEATFFKHGIEQTLRFSFDGKERRVLHNSTVLSTISSLLGLIQGVVLTPDDVNLIKGPPLLRRQFLDIQIAQADPLYVHHLTRYTRAMRHRNQLLKLQQTATIETWEHEMSQSAAYLILQRRQAIHDLQRYCQSIHPLLTGETASFGIDYKTNYQGEMASESIYRYFFNQLKTQRFREMKLGYTLIGPHKDDLIITIADKDARSFASEGQQRSCVTTLRFAEWERLKQLSEQTPLMMIDDVGMGLDDNRRRCLVERLETLGQVFLTTTDDKLLSRQSLSHQILPVFNGAIRNLS